MWARLQRLGLPQENVIQHTDEHKNLVTRTQSSLTKSSQKQIFTVISFCGNWISFNIVSTRKLVPQQADRDTPGSHTHAAAVCFNAVCTSEREHNEDFRNNSTVWEMKMKKERELFSLLLLKRRVSVSALKNFSLKWRFNQCLQCHLFSRFHACAVITSKFDFNELLALNAKVLNANSR